MTVLNVLVAILAWSQSEGFYFTSTTVEGVEVSYYSQSSEYPYYCNVQGRPTTEGGMPQPAISTTTTGSVTIPETVYYNGNTYHVEYIDMNAFNSCSQITSVTLPESVIMIGESAFYGCRSMKSIMLPKKALPNYTFFIGYAAFENCTSLTEISLPESLKELPSFVFNNCYKLQSITLPSTLQSIDYGAFNGCSELAKVSIKATIPPTLDASAFDNTSNITLCVPQGSKTAYEAADYWKNFKEIIEDASLQIISFADSKVKELCVANWDTNGDGELDVDEAATVTDLGAVFQWIPDVNEAPMDLQSFDELKYFTGLTTIGEDAFSGCSMLASMTLPGTLASIGARAFYGCNSLKSIVIPNSVSSIGSQAFFGCRSLTSFHIPASVSIIYGNPIVNCPKIASITVADDNASYDSRDNCNAVIRTSNNTLIAGCMSSVIPNTVKVIGWGAFEECAGLTSVVIPSSVTTINDRAFYGCSSLNSITISHGVQTIGGKAFYGCSKVSSLTIPASVTSISDYAFQYCSALNTIIVASGNTVFDSREDCNAIIKTETNTLIQGSQQATIPNTVVSIGDNAFSGFKNITEVIIPESVTSIGSWAFGNCADLESVVIPGGITLIGNAAFYNCPNLKTVKAKMKSPCNIGERVFQYYNNASQKTEFTTAKLQVPYGCKTVYQATDCWNKFSVIEESGKCATPTISFKDGRLHFECETEGVEYHATITPPDSEELTGNDIALPLTYIIKVYASKEDYVDSDVATANIDIRGLRGDLNEDSTVNALDIQEVINIAAGE